MFTGHTKQMLFIVKADIALHLAVDKRFLRTNGKIAIEITLDSGTARGNPGVALYPRLAGQDHDFTSRRERALYLSIDSEVARNREYIPAAGPFESPIRDAIRHLRLRGIGAGKKSKNGE